MLRQDLLGYVLLGDPAARLPITPASGPPPRLATPSDFFPFAVAARPAASAVGPVSIQPLEAAILQWLAGQPVADATIQHAGVDRAELERLAGLYRTAGRAAIADHKPAL